MSIDFDVFGSISCISTTSSWQGAREPTEREMHATSVIAVEIEHAEAKIRNHGVGDDADDLSGPWWVGLLPVERRIPEAIPSPDL